MNFCLDTCFLIDAQRERRRGHGLALDFLRAHAGATFSIPTVAWGEFAEGRTPDNERALLEIRRAVELLPITEAVAETYARLARSLRERGALIPTNDLWIAATALAHDLELVTANLDEFRRIENLRLRPY